jgi:DNA-binding transcriptional LysR family regulator
VDRIEAMKVFVAVLDEGSLAGAARRLKRSPAAVSRAIAFLEAHVGAELLHRTTRSLRLSEAGERYAIACRRILVELEEAELVVAGARSTPRGILTISAPPVSGNELLHPIIEQFLFRHPDVSVRLMLLDRPVNLIDEGVDVALRIGNLRDSSLIATRVGQNVRRVVVGSPGYLEGRAPVGHPGDLAHHSIVAFTNFGIDSWTFPPAAGSSVARTVQFVPRLSVNAVPAAVQAAVAGIGLTRLYSYHVADAVRVGALRVILDGDEPAPLPVHLLTPPGRISVPKVRAFLDFAARRLRLDFARLAVEADALH